LSCSDNVPPEGHFLISSSKTIISQVAIKSTDSDYGKSVSPPCQSHLNVHEMQREVPSLLLGNPIPMSRVP
jgi:hypothetical protein